MQRTLVLLKPDCVQRRLAGKVINRFEEKGLNIVAMAAAAPPSMFLTKFLREGEWVSAMGVSAACERYCSKVCS